MNIVAYRLPEEDGSLKRIYQCGYPVPFTFRNDKEGFVVGTFDSTNSPLLYPYERDLDDFPREYCQCKDPGIFKEFSKEDYTQYIGYIKTFLQGAEEEKIVASRRIFVPACVNPGFLFKELCDTYPDAFIFLISTHEFGCWIGASPELLLKCKGGSLETMSLAGTRKVNSDDSWDEKNVKEQQIVTDYICNVFKQTGFKPEIGLTKTKKAGNIEHLMTPISSIITDNGNLGELLGTLSPTPALSGFPKEAAMKIIREKEGDRILYGGFCGPYANSRDFRFNVILRCAFLSKCKSVLFAGGGITSLSNPETEWMETENKFATLRRFF